MRIGLYQNNPTVGDLEANAAKIAQAIENAKRMNVTFAIFPELAMCGYPPRDLLDRQGFVERMRVQRRGSRT
jgi:NAD+ synthase (glutamine-hydrolysing)